jgi:hypothetical protein
VRDTICYGRRIADFGLWHEYLLMGREVFDSMDRMDFWNVFEKTGSVEDYLNYTACTGEVNLREMCGEDGDRVYGDCTGERSWDRFVGDAGGGD